MSRVSALQKAAAALSLEELVVFDNWIHQQIERLEDTAIHEVPVRSDRKVVEIRHEGRITYRRELVRCGKCKACAIAPAHGPYWYAYWKDGGRTRTAYIGKDLARVDQQLKPSG